MGRSQISSGELDFWFCVASDLLTLLAWRKNNLAYLNLLLFNLQRSKGLYLASVVGWLSLLVNFSILVYFG